MEQTGPNVIGHPRQPAFLVAWRSLVLAACLGATPASAKPPNIIVIISDDAGFGDFGFMSAYSQTSDDIPTPALDSLATRGLTCTNAYSMAVCSPTRAAIMTGIYPNRFGYEFNINNSTTDANGWDGLRPDVVTLFERMLGLGYTTGAIGKWHLGAIPDQVSGTVITRPGNRPPRQGVMEYFGMLSGARTYSVGSATGIDILREMHLDANGLEVDTPVESSRSGEYLTEAFGRAAADFIGRHHAEAAPFFLYVAFNAPHAPVHSSPDIDDPRLASLTGTRKNYASMVLTMDKEIGRILGKLDDPAGDGTGAGHDADAITGQTLLFFVNDNGAPTGNGGSNLPLRDWKNSPWDGGWRVPMVIAGAGITAAAGSSFHKPVHITDILPTCIAAAGGTPPNGIDGVNLLPFLNGEFGGNPHDELFFRRDRNATVRRGDPPSSKTAPVRRSASTTWRPTFPKPPTSPRRIRPSSSK